MAHVKNPLTLMQNDAGIGWEYLAILGTDAKHSRSTYKIYLHRRKRQGGGSGEWWCFEETMPMVTTRSEAPARCYVEPLNFIRGPVRRFPDWLDFHPEKPALVAVARACRELSEYCEEVPHA